MMAKARTTDAAGEPVSGATRVARGEPVSAYSNWDPQRRALILHSDRDAGSSYDQLPINEPSVDGAAGGDANAAKRTRRRKQ